MEMERGVAAHVHVAVYCQPSLVGSLHPRMSACLFPAKETGQPSLPRRPIFSPHFRMELIIALSCNHDYDEDTRLAALGEPTVDIRVDSWIYNTFAVKTLKPYPNAETEGWTKAPKALVVVALGRAMIAVGGGDEPDK